MNLSGSRDQPTPMVLSGFLKKTKEVSTISTERRNKWIKKIKSESKKSKQTFSFDVDIKVHRKGCETYWLTQKEKGLVIYLGGLVKGVLCRLFSSYGYKLEYVV